MNPALKTLAVGLVAGLVPATAVTAFLAPTPEDAESVVESVDSMAVHGVSPSAEEDSAAERGTEGVEPPPSEQAVQEAAMGAAAPETGSEPDGTGTLEVVAGSGAAPRGAIPGRAPVETDGGGGGEDEAVGPITRAAGTLPAERMAKILGSMRPRTVAAVLEGLEDARIRELLAHLSDTQVAAILAQLPPERVAGLVKGALAPAASEQTGAPDNSPAGSDGVSSSGSGTGGGGR